MKLLKLAFILTVLPISAAASPSGGGGEGPPGCNWRATVLEATRDNGVMLNIKLTQLIGTCMYNHGPCGEKEQLVSVRPDKDDIRKFQPRQIIKVWVAGDKVSFEQPQCTRTPGIGAK